MRPAPPVAGKKYPDGLAGQRERDEDLERTYALSPSALEILGDALDAGSTLAAVAARASDLAADFWHRRREISTEDPREALLRYEARTFGRQLEPAAHGILAREVTRRLHHARADRAPSLFASRAEEEHWANCAREAGDDRGEAGALEYVERIADLATGRHRMSPAEVSARRQELRRQALLIGAGAPEGSRA